MGGKLRNLVHLGVTVTPEMRAEIDAVVHEVGGSRTAVVRWLLTAGLRAFRRGDITKFVARDSDIEEAA